MATPIAFALTPDFDLQNVVGQLGVVFQRKGYTIRSYPLGAGACLELERHKGGLNAVLGRCEGLKVNFMPGATMLNVSFSDEEWADKAIAFVVGWFTCWIPWIFAGMGVYSQYKLPRKVENELRIIMGSGSISQAAYYQSPAAGQSRPYQSYQPYQPYSPYSGSGGYVPPAGGYPAASAPPSAAGTPPPAADTPPSAAGTPPSAASTPPSAAGTPPSAASTPSSAAGTPPVAAPKPPVVPGPAAPGKKVCPACGRSIDSDCDFCIYCGVRQPS